MSKLNVQFRRKREKKTDYRQRLKLLLSNRPRLVVRKSLKRITAQIVEYTPDGDKVVAGVNSKALIKLGWNQNTGNTPAAYLTGLMLGKKAKKKGVSDAILDLGFKSSTKGSRVYATLKGVIDAGIKIPVKEDILPDDKRISGEHIIKYAAQNKNNFTKARPEQLKQAFEKVKKEIEKNG